MPVSFEENKGIVLDWYRKIAPTRNVLDIGPGVGTYSKLIDNKKARWIGVEIWAPYLEEYQLFKHYDEVIIADARYLSYGQLSPIDLIIAGDVIEHMAREDAIEMIQRWKMWANNIIISVPIVDIHQTVDKGNTWETHLHQWRFKEMQTLLGAGVVEVLEGRKLGYFWWKSDIPL